MSAPPVLVLTGPTATGKSDWAAELAARLPLEIVSCDSAQVYRGMDIGTAKPDAATRAAIPHHLIDIRDPAEAYSAGEFAADARDAIGAIQARGHIPLVVGGTLLYLRSLIAGIAELPRADAGLRARIDGRAAQLGWPALHAELALRDPDAAARIHPNDSQRIQRALEVVEATGRPLSEWQREAAARVPAALRFERWALIPGERAVLHERIERRFVQMIERGLLDEVRRLHGRGDLTAAHTSMRAVGYRQLWRHLDGEEALDTAIARGIAASRQLAKRQLTWLNADATLRRIDPTTGGAREAWIDAVLRALNA